MMPDGDGFALCSHAQDFCLLALCVCVAPALLPDRVGMVGVTLMQQAA